MSVVLHAKSPNGIRRDIDLDNIGHLVGSVQAYAGSDTPTGWLLCDGSAISRTTYATLFSIIGTIYGAGNGSTTFNLPNLTDKFIQGNGTVGTVKNAGLPSVEGFLNFVVEGSESGGGLDVNQTSVSNNKRVVPSAANANWRVELNFSRGNSIYGNSTTVQPPALTMRYVIKY